MGSKSSRRDRASANLRKRLAEVRACEEAGESLKGYAKRRGLSVHMLYQAKKLARQQGLLPAHKAKPVARKRSKAHHQPHQSRFVEAVLRSEAREPAVAWRLRLSTGVVFESATPIAPDEIIRLVDSLQARS